MSAIKRFRATLPTLGQALDFDTAIAEARSAPRKPGCIYKHPHPDHECRNQDDMREGAAPRAEGPRCGCPRCAEHDAAYGRPAPRSEGTDVPTRHDWRLVLFLHHGHDGLYGDDGEMQCPHYPPVDFMRDHIDALIGHIEAAGLSARLTPEPGERQPRKPWPGYFSPDDDRDGGHSDR